jgi:hypothetical protein
MNFLFTRSNQNTPIHPSQGYTSYENQYTNFTPAPTIPHPSGTGNKAFIPATGHSQLLSWELNGTLGTSLDFMYDSMQGMYTPFSDLEMEKSIPHMAATGMPVIPLNLYRTQSEYQVVEYVI